MKPLRLKPVILASLLALLLIVIAFLVVMYQIMKNDQSEPTPLPEKKWAYSIDLDNLEITYATIKSNDNLSSLLSPMVNGTTIDRMVRESSPVFDVRKIKAGNTYALLKAADSTKALRYFIYEINPIDFVVYDLRDSVVVYPGKKAVDRKIVSARGTITSSLWNAFAEQKLDFGLAMALADVYAWSIDFYGLQKGDNFSVIYEELYVEKHCVGIDRILAARFNTGGKDFYAYYFDQEGKGKGTWFDGQGVSLQRSFLKAPLKFSRISSRFSKSRMHPILRIARPHYGVDYSAPKGTPVVALGNGRVLEVTFKGGYGRYISIRHNAVYTTSYAHLSGYAKGIKPGVQVTQGQVIGFVGSSGLSTGPHLDFRVYKNGSPVNPLTIESPPSDPVRPALMNAYRHNVHKLDSLLHHLDDTLKK